MPVFHAGLKMKTTAHACAFETLCQIPLGKHSDPHGAISTPIYQSATFAHRSVAQPGDFDYSRVQNPTREQLEANRDIIGRINRRMGYRINMTEAEWPATIRKNEAFIIRSAWRNAGVAPCYGGGYPCFTIKNDKGGIVAVLVDDGFNVKDLAVGKPGEAAATRRQVEFTVAQAFTNSFGTFRRSCPTGTFEIYFSVGTVYGSPTLQLPYDNDDGHKRYRMGTVTLTE